MAYYTALIAAWNGVTQPPAGVTGAAITGGMTTAQKIAAVNGWTITGSVPTSFFTTGNAVLNCINYTEFKALTATQQANLLGMLAVQGALLGGSANTSKMVAGMIIDMFPVAGPTVAALTALAQGIVQPWATASTGGGLNGPVSQTDATAAGLS